MKSFITLLLLMFSSLAFAQEADSNSVVIHEDSRIALIVHKPVAKPFSGKASGFRVQIYNGNDREKANQIKLDFLRQFPDKRAYLTYHKPQFRVRVGDFHNRNSATEFSHLLPRNYTIMIVPEIVNIVPAKNKKAND